MSEGERAADPEITRLLLGEFRRHAPALEPGAPASEQRRALHALKGSAGIAGERAASEAFARLERRLNEGDASALEEARAFLREALAALSEGRAIPTRAWPDPPEDLRVSPRDPALGPRYVVEMHDRLERLDHALSTTGDDEAALLATFREVHAMKGAALAVGDEVMAWFCHGLESRLRTTTRTPEKAKSVLAELGRWRGVLAELIVAPEHALETLRMLSRPRRNPSLPPPMSQPVPSRPVPSRRMAPKPTTEAEARATSEGDASLRVPTATLDRLFERVRQLGQARTQVTEGARLVYGMAEEARKLRLTLSEARRMIGPPRPWGAPALSLSKIEDAVRRLSLFAEQLEREGLVLKETSDRVRVEAAAAHSDLATIRTTTVAWLFERVAAAASAEAQRARREVKLSFTGEEAAIDRRLAEMLLDPVLQLARNAVVHGIEPAMERSLRGKPRVGSVRLSAQRRSGGLRFVVADDGTGVDVAEMRRQAIARGTISSEMAESMDDETLLSLLFVPGFTTRESADLLAGRGVGLDLALEAVHRLGGTIRLATQAGMGMTATLDIPFEPGLFRVIWIEAGSVTYALPVQSARRILLGRDPEVEAVVPLSACMGLRRLSLSDSSPPLTIDEGARPAYAVELEPAREGERPPLVGVDRVGSTEEVALRAVSPLIATAGPYMGAIVRGNELRLCLDALALAEMIGSSTGRAISSASSAYSSAYSST